MEKSPPSEQSRVLQRARLSQPLAPEHIAELKTHVLEQQKHTCQRHNTFTYAHARHYTCMQSSTVSETVVDCKQTRSSGSAVQSGEGATEPI